MVGLQSTWQVIALIAVVVSARAAVASLPRWERQKALALELADAGLIAVLLVFCLIRPFVLQAFFIPSGSMEPTLQENDRILVNKLVYFFRDPRPGEVIVFRAPPAAAADQRDFIKRCVGVPGDRIQVKDGTLYRNDQPVREPYIRAAPIPDWPEDGRPIVVPDDMLLMFGDNRGNSDDSRSWSCYTEHGREEAPFLPREDVIGKADVIFWPPQRMHVLH